MSLNIQFRFGKCYDFFFYVTIYNEGQMQRLYKLIKLDSNYIRYEGEKGLGSESVIE